MRALVIGGTGPSGSFVVEGLLERGAEVVVMHSGQHEVEPSPPVEHVHADVHFEPPLREALGSRSFDVVVSLYGRLRIIADVMVDRTEHLVSIGATDSPPPDHPSWGANGRPFARTEESAEPDPQWDPFHHKIYLAEQYVLDHHRAGHYRVTHLRYPYIYGPRAAASGDWSIVRRVLDGRRRLIIADGGAYLQSRAFAANAARAVLLAVEKPELSAGKVYNVADEEPLSVLDRVNAIARALNHQFEVVNMPFDLARPFHPIYWRQYHNALDITKIKTELGYRDAVPARKALAITAQWLAENRPEPGGELETQLGDRFHYAAEDAIIDSFQKAREAVLEVPFENWAYVHPYRHPKHPNERWQRPERPFGVVS